MIKTMVLMIRTYKTMVSITKPWFLKLDWDKTWDFYQNHGFDDLDHQNHGFNKKSRDFLRNHGFQIIFCANCSSKTMVLVRNHGFDELLCKRSSMFFTKNSQIDNETIILQFLCKLFGQNHEFGQRPWF